MDEGPTRDRRRTGRARGIGSAMTREPIVFDGDAWGAGSATDHGNGNWSGSAAAAPAGIRANSAPARPSPIRATDRAATRASLPALPTCEGQKVRRVGRGRHEAPHPRATSRWKRPPLPAPRHRQRHSQRHRSRPVGSDVVRRFRGRGAKVRVPFILPRLPRSFPFPQGKEKTPKAATARATGRDRRRIEGRVRQSVVTRHVRHLAHRLYTPCPPVPDTTTPPALASRRRRQTFRIVQAKRTVAFARRRRAPPTAPKPRIIRAQVAGSGTDATVKSPA